jgi:hypothetical protein
VNKNAGRGNHIIENPQFLGLINTHQLRITAHAKTRHPQHRDRTHVGPIVRSTPQLGILRSPPGANPIVERLDDRALRTTDPAIRNQNKHR